jgi:hypothetical protein
MAKKFHDNINTKDNRKPGHTKKSIYDGFNTFFDKNHKFFLYVLLFANAIFAFLLFDFKVSIGGDDSAYIKMAYSFIHEGNFPTFQGPLYPIFLGGLISIFGINLTLFKIFSVVFVLLHFYFFYKAFFKRVPSFLLFFTMIIIAFNPYLLQYASLTYTEAFFMMLQSVLFLFFFNNFIQNESSGALKQEYKKYLVLGLIVVLIGLCRSIGFAALIAVILYFLIKLKWKPIIYTITSFFSFYIIVEGIKKLFFNKERSQFTGQLTKIMQKDFYNASKGQENLLGFIERFFKNMDQYISHHFYKFFGFRPEIAEDITAITIITLVIFGIGIFFAIKERNNYQLFNGIYIATFTGVTFLVLHTRWDQERLILVYLPLMLLILLYALYKLSLDEKFKWFKGLFIILLIIMFFTNLSVLVNKIKSNKENLIHNLAGDMYYGFTPDWINYLKMSEYAAENVPDSVMIASRKSNMSFIYGKRFFYRIGEVPTNNPDTLINRLKKNNVHYVIMGSLRRNPHMKTEYTINTVKRYLYYIQQKYPYIFNLEKKVGADEPAYLYKINYDKLKYVNPDYKPKKNIE